jgi:hypothetical protein
MEEWKNGRMEEWKNGKKIWRTTMNCAILFPFVCCYHQDVSFVVNLG